MCAVLPRASCQGGPHSAGPPLDPPARTGRPRLERGVRPVCSVSPLHHSPCQSHRGGSRAARDFASLDARERPAVSRSGSHNRKRRKLLSARFNEQEALALRQRADRAGIPLSAYMRSAALGTPEPRAARRPTVNHQLVARLLGELGRIADELHRAAEAGDLTPSNPEVAAAMRDLAEMRAVCLEALGRQP